MKKGIILKRIWLILGITLVLIITVIVIGYTWVTNYDFRCNFNIIFNCEDTHSSYVVNDNGDVKVVTIELPASTTVAYKHSDTAVAYYTKLEYEDFLKYYSDNGYEVKDGKVYIQEGIFVIKDINEQMEKEWKYNFVDIDFIMKKKEIGKLNEDSHMTFKMLPSPPKMKETSNITIIEEVLTCVDNSLKKPIEEESLKGWEIFIRIENGEKSIDISIIGDKIQINNAWYQIPETLKRDLTEIYNNMEE